MSKDLQEIKAELNDILEKWDREGRFNINTMSQVEKDARSAKVLILGSHQYSHEMLRELDQTISISEKYHRLKLGVDNDIIREALRHLEWGIQLFFDRVE